MLNRTRVLKNRVPVREAKRQAAIVRYVRIVAPPPGMMIWHTPNGEQRDPRVAAKLLWMGVLPGVLDLTMVFTPTLRAPRGIAFMDAKTDKGGLTESQKGFVWMLDEQGIPWNIVRSIDDARLFLIELGVPTREVPQGVLL